MCYILVERFHVFTNTNDLISEAMMLQSKAWHRGHSDYDSGKTFSSNPYTKPSYNSAAWAEAWMAAYEEHQKKIEAVVLQSLVIVKSESVFIDSTYQYSYLECKMQEATISCFNAHPLTMTIGGVCYRKKSWNTHINIVYYRSV